MIDVTKIYYFIFGALTILGGVIGFVKKASSASLIAGGLCGVLLLIAGLLLRGQTAGWPDPRRHRLAARSPRFLPKFIEVRLDAAGIMTA
jgi:uncharacterized membrane protein (UPF0136 family)